MRAGYPITNHAEPEFALIVVIDGIESLLLPGESTL